MKPYQLILFAAALAGGLFLYYGLPADAVGYVPWDQALQRAKAERKPIFLNFGGPW
jgi:hypothetical protein